MEEQFNKEAKEGCRFAADAASITDERALRTRSIHQEVFFVAVDSNLGAVAGEKDGAVTSIPDNEGVNVRGGMNIFAAHFWHAEGWTPRKEAILEAVLEGARVTKHPWLLACDANIAPVALSGS